MRLKAWGCRGSISVSDKKKTRYGGNTTCYEVESKCLPDGTWLLFDGGTGMVPASAAFMAARAQALYVFYTHWHHDHTGGFPLSIFPYVDHIPVSLYGPVEHGYGP